MADNTFLASLPSHVRTAGVVWFAGVAMVGAILVVLVPLQSVDDELESTLSSASEIRVTPTEKTEPAKAS